MNSYSTQFTVNDPATGHPIRYVFKVKTPPQVVIDVADFVAIELQLAKRARTPEEIADFLKGRFPGKHTLSTSKFGVAVKLQRVGSA
jgi:hypothetical protein